MISRCDNTELYTLDVGLTIMCQNQSCQWLKTEESCIYEVKYEINDHVTQEKGYIVQHSPRLEELDLALLRELHAEGRAPWPKVAEKIGCSPSTARRRYEALRSSGKIRVVGRVDASFLGQGTPAMVRFSGPDADKKEFLEKLRSRSDVRFLSAVLGSSGSAAEFIASSMADLQSSLRELTPEFDVAAESFVETHIYTQGQDWLPDSLSKRVATEHRPAREAHLSAADHTVATMLIKDGRAQLGELAEAIGKSENTARRIIENLRKREILEFRVLVEPQVLGFEIEMMIWLDVDAGKLEEVGQDLASYHGTKFLAATAGRFALVGQVVLPHHSDMFDFSTKVLGNIPGIRRVETLLQTDVHKRVWNCVERGVYTGFQGLPNSYVAPSHHGVGRRD